MAASVPCPVCFEIEDPNLRESRKVTYARVSNHSWSNSNRCDGHSLCWSCLAKYVEIQVMERGKANVRCPGLGCSYRLLPEDVARAVETSQGKKSVLERLDALQSQRGEERLRELVHEALRDRSSSWLLEESQPCPRCLVLARRETGCNSVVCRCGTNFCFRCGGPFDDGCCLCGWLDRHEGEVAFAAWLRWSEASPCAWLWDWHEPDESESARFVNTLGFWLWLAGAWVQPPATWDGHVSSTDGVLSELAPISWSEHDGWDEVEDEFFFDELPYWFFDDSGADVGELEDSTEVFQHTVARGRAASQRRFRSEACAGGNGERLIAAEGRRAAGQRVQTSKRLRKARYCCWLRSGAFEA